LSLGWRLLGEVGVGVDVLDVVVGFEAFDDFLDLLGNVDP